MSDDKQAAMFAALSRAVAKAHAVAKDSENTFSRYKYASAEALIEESRGCLASEGLAIIPIEHRLAPLVGGPVSTGGKAGMYFADVVVSYLVTHKDGGATTCHSTTPACTDNGRPQDKAVATALTYSLGYFLRSLLLLPRVDAEHDVDQRNDSDYDPRRGDRRSARPAPQPEPSGYDVEKVIAAIRAATDDDSLRIIADDISANAPKSATPRLRAEWGKRKRDLQGAKAA